MTATRGRRQIMRTDEPALARIEDDDEMLIDMEDAESRPTMLIDGDTIMAKVTHSVSINGQDSWFTYGSTTRLLPGEAEEEAYYRLSAVVNGRVLDLVSDHINELDARQEDIETQLRDQRKERARRNKITPRG